MRLATGSVALLFACALSLGCKGGGEDASPAIEVSPVGAEFGRVGIGQSATQELVVSNTGGGTLEILSITLTSGDVDVWTFAADRADLGPGEYLVLGVTFAPEREQQEYGGIQIRSNDPDDGTLLVQLSGVGGPSEADGDADGYTPADGDCDDGQATVYPGAEELCDGRDNDCDDEVPAEEADGDGDGVRICEGDCDDSDRDVAPGNPEICDDKDSDCDGRSVDRDDVDGDGLAICDDDCDDDESATYPGAPETCDGLDNDCSGLADDLDVDADGHSPCSVAGDCDDLDASAYPLFVDASVGSSAPDGSDAAPFHEIADAIAALDETCRQIVVAAGDYEVSATVSDAADFTVSGAGAGVTTLRAPAGQRIFNLITAGLVLEDLTLADGEVSGDGGAIHGVDALIELVRVEVRDNHCTGDGGAIGGKDNKVLLVDCELTGNSADDDGGAIALLSGVLDDAGSTWSGNSAVRGGAIVLESSDVAVRDALFDGNTASDEGGAIAMTSMEGCAIDQSAFWRNTAVNGGGALALDNVVQPSSGRVSNNRFQDNAGGTLGGAVSIGGATAAFSLSNNTMTGNSGSGQGACVHVSATDASSLQIVANIIGWCDGSSAMHVPATSLAAPAYNTVFATSSGNAWSGQALEGVTGNDTENPVFTTISDDGDPTNDDLSLQSSSPMIDSGPPDAEWNDRDGTQNDRGYTGGPFAE